MKNRSITNWYAAAALTAGVMTAPLAFGQTAGLELQQAKQREAEQKKQEQQANKQERRELKREREQLNNMPEAPRKVLRAETTNAKDVDYYRVPDQRPPQFGAQFTAADGKRYDLRVDRQGNVVSRQDLTAATAAAQAPITAPQQPAPVPAPAPAPAPAPGTSARVEAPPSGDPIYRQLQANEVPASIRAQFDRDTAGARDAKYYRTKYGTQLAYEVKWTDPKTGKDMKHYVSDDGRTLVRGEIRDDDDNAQTAGASTPAAKPADTSIKTGRAELNDLPRAVQTQFRRMTEGARDVDFYRTKYGSQQAYEAKYTTRDGKNMAVYLDESGKVLSQKELKK